MRKTGLFLLRTTRATVLALAICFACSVSSSATTFTFDFESGAPPEVSGAGGVVDVTGFPSSAGLGTSSWRNDTSGNPASPTYISLAGMDPHESLAISFDLIAFDSWDGLDPIFGPDYFTLTIGSSSIYVAPSWDGYDAFSTSGPFNFGSVYITLFDETDYSGDQYQYPDKIFELFFSIPHTATTETLRFYASGAGWQGGDDESFALDNINIQTYPPTPTTVPEPSTMLLLGSGLLGLVGLNRRRKA